MVLVRLADSIVVVTNTLLLARSKYLPVGAWNFTNDPASKYWRSVAANVPVRYAVASVASPTYPVLSLVSEVFLNQTIFKLSVAILINLE